MIIFVYVTVVININWANIPLLQYFLQTGIAEKILVQEKSIGSFRKVTNYESRIMNSGFVIRISYTIKIQFRVLPQSEFRIWPDDVIPVCHHVTTTAPRRRANIAVTPFPLSHDVTPMEPRRHVETGIPTIFMIFTSPFEHRWINIKLSSIASFAIPEYSWQIPGMYLEHSSHFARRTRLIWPLML
jgi:hypothetical protein